MILYLFLPLFLLLLIILQNTVSEILFFGVVGMEISLILVIYVGFRLDVFKGGMISFLLGFFLDCFTGSFSGFYALIYVCVFLVSMSASLRITLEKAPLIMLFTLMCALLEGIMITILYPLIYNIDIISIPALTAYLPQTLIVVLVSPVFFQIFRRIEALLENVANAKQLKRI